MSIILPRYSVSTKLPPIMGIMMLPIDENMVINSAGTVTNAISCMTALTICIGDNFFFIVLTP